MQSFSTEGNSFMPFNLGGYFCVYPSFWPHNLPLYSFNTPAGFQTPKEDLPLQALVPPFAPNSSLIPRQEHENQVAVTKVGKTSSKGRKVGSEGEEEQGEEEQFKIKIGKNSSNCSVAYKKKNTQSNIVNQSFSYLTSQRSKALVSTYFKGDVHKVEEYYRAMLKIKQGSKKYINRKYLARLLAFDSKSEFERAYHKAKLTLLSIQDLQTALRVLLYHFLRNQINQTLLTSCKIYKETLPEHFWRRREILRYLFPKKKFNQQ